MLVYKFLVEGEKFLCCVRLLQLEVSLALFTLLFHFNFPFVAFFLPCSFFFFLFHLSFGFVFHSPALSFPSPPALFHFPDQAAAVGYSRPGEVPQPHSQLHP